MLKYLLIIIENTYNLAMKPKKWVKIKKTGKWNPIIKKEQLEKKRVFLTDLNFIFNDWIFLPLFTHSSGWTQTVSCNNT